MKKTITLFSFLLLSITVFAQYTAIPDANFENALAAYDDIPGDGQVPTANIDSVFYLNLTGLSISDLTGIEDFVALERLYCGDNLLTSLDVSNNTLLYDLFCFENQLTSLVVSNNTLLTTISCRGNQISSLDFSQNLLLEDIVIASNNLSNLDVSMLPNLLDLSCSDNPLNSLDVTQNPLLTTLVCFSNGLTTLDISNNTMLETLACFNNQLTEFDLSAHPFLTEIWLLNNQLTSLDLRNGANTNIIEDNFNVTGNPNLTCISVDDVAYSNANWTNIDAQTSFDVDCALSNEDFNSSSFSLYPNPTINSFTVASKVLITQVVIFDNLGREVAKFNGQESYNISHLNSGIYFVSIVSENNSQIKKLVVN